MNIYKMHSDDIDHTQVADSKLFQIQSYTLAPSSIDPYVITNGVIDMFNKLEEGNVRDALMDAATEVMSSSLSFTIDVVKGEMVKSIKDAVVGTMDKGKEIINQSDNGRTVDEKAVPTSVWILPVPNDLINSLSHNYDSDSLSYAEIMARKSPGYLLAKMSPGFPGKDMMVESFEKFSTLAFDLAKRQGVTVDPNLISVYKGTECRQFNFHINVIPQNAQEAREFVRGITALKKEMTGYREALVLRHDVVFKIVFTSKSLQEYMGLGKLELNLISVDMDIGADGGMQLFKDGMPKFIRLNLVFVERRPLRNEVSMEVKINEEPPLRKVNSSGISTPYVVNDAANPNLATGVTDQLKDKNPHVDPNLATTVTNQLKLNAKTPDTVMINGVPFKVIGTIGKPESKGE